MQHIAEEIDRLVRREVARLREEDQTWKQRYDDLVWELQEMRAQAQALFDDMRAHGLTVNSIEAEGYLRGCIQATSLLDA